MLKDSCFSSKETILHTKVVSFPFFLTVMTNVFWFLKCYMLYETHGNFLALLILHSMHFIEISIFRGSRTIMPGILLGSNLLKKGVSWRGLKGFVIFSLGFYAHGVLFPNPRRVLQEVTESYAEAKSLSGELDAQLDELRKNKKVLDDLVQLYVAGLAELKELKEANGH
ncbi:hypothetical protein HA466_0108610 [Hirschfeldia incana]|nr:hypothetical protein HA466_0108610 [Hirschfeldia incana]KAJ0254354.1 hypothetical protein HA466_0108610 [Hirschfeldia incana]